MEEIKDFNKKERDKPNSDLPQFKEPNRYFFSLVAHKASTTNRMKHTLQNHRIKHILLNVTTLEISFIMKKQMVI